MLSIYKRKLLIQCHPLTHMIEKKLSEIITQNEKVIYELLSYSSNVLKGMQVFRNSTAISFLVDRKNLSYEDANRIFDALVSLNYLAIRTQDIFPSTMITEIGQKFLDSFSKKYSKINEGGVSAPVVSKDQPTKSMTPIDQKPVRKFEITNDQIYRFLKFVHNVCKESELPYIRSLVAEQYCHENLGQYSEETDEFLNFLSKYGYIEMYDFSFVPGLALNKKAIDFLEEFEGKYNEPSISGYHSAKKIGSSYIFI
jgi:predicted transcriptional regulator